MLTMFEVSKSRAEDRFTLSPIYLAGSVDAHGEFTDASTLQKALWSFMDKTDRNINLQHRRGVTAGKLVELVCWPSAHTTVLHTPGEVSKSREVTFPPGTAYAGVRWAPFAWSMIKAGKLLGLSMAGSARRVRAVNADFDDHDGAVTKSLTAQLVADEIIKAAALRPHHRATAYQAPLTPSDLPSLAAALESLPKLADQQTAWAQIQAAAAKIAGGQEFLARWLAAKEARANSSGADAQLAALLAADQAQSAQTTAASLSAP